jgi:hypothetical protein
LATFEYFLPLVIFENAELIRWQWFEKFMKICESEIQEARKNGN